MEVRKINDLKEVAPQSKAELNKDNMTDYVINYVLDEKPELAIKFLDIVEDSVVLRQNNLVEGDIYETYDLKVIREEFCVMFKEFYKLSDKFKSEEAAEKAKVRAKAKKEKEAEDFRSKLANAKAQAQAKLGDNVLPFAG